MGFGRDELARLVAAVGERDEVSMLELNVSCPNVETGLIMGADPAETALALERVRPETAKPLIVKLTPNATDPGAVAAAAEEAGADAVSLVNTLKGMALHPETGDPWLGGRTGGLSGPAIRAIALEQVSAVASRVEDSGDRHGRNREWAPGGRFHGRGGLRGRDWHRKLPRPGRRTTNRRRARRARPLGQDRCHRLDTRLSPFGGHTTRSFCGRCGNFSPVAGESANLLTKSPANERKTLKDPKPT